MTQYASSLMIFNLPGNGNTAHNVAAVEAGGVEACTAALEAVPSDQWLRQVSLLRGRAIHHLERSETAAALADLDRADAVASAHSDVFYDRSMGVGVKLIRALALRMSGDLDKARDLARAAMATRPFAHQSAFLALVSLGGGQGWGELGEILRANARFNPSPGLDFMFQQMLREGRFGEAVALYPQLVPPERLDQVTPWPQQEQLNRAMREIFWATRSGECAYALAALGRGQEAQAMLDAARERLAKATESPPEPAGPEKADDRARRMLVINNNLQIGSHAKPSLEEMAELVKLRLMLGDGHADAVAQAMAASPPHAPWIQADLLDALAALRPAEAAADRAAAKAIRDKLTDIVAGGALGNLSGLWTNLPEPETAQRVPPYHEAKAWYEWTDRVKNDFYLQPEGFRSRPAPPPAPPGAVAVRYRGLKGTATIVEEMALLRAAELAQEAGKGGSSSLAGVTSISA